MKTESKKLDKCQVQLTVTLSATEAKAIVKDVERAFMREAKLPGFRPGKVPLELVRKEFATGLKQECERTAVQRHLHPAVESEKLDSVAVSEVKDVSCTTDGGAFTAVVEVKPEFKLPAYKGLKIAPVDAAVKDADVTDQIERLRAAYATYEDAKEGEAVASGDFVQIDYAGTVDGKPIVELNPEAKIVSSGTGFWTQVEEGRFLPELLEAVTGMKAGETKDGIKATFDKDAAPEGLKGAKALYSLTLKSFRRRILPDDATLVEKAKAESLEKLTATVRGQLEKSATEREENRRENEVIEALLKKADFDVPPSQVHRAMDSYLQQIARRAQYSGLPADYFEKNRDKILKDAEETAQKQLRLLYIIDAIAAEEKIEASDQDRGKKVFDFILANAK